MTSTQNMLEENKLHSWISEGSYMRANSKDTYGDKQNDEATDRVGDVRISYEIYPTGSIYIFAQ